MAGTGIIEMSIDDFKEKKPGVCPKCGTFAKKGKEKCSKCETKLSDYTIVRCQSCSAIFDFSSMKDNKCPNCDKELSNLEIIIPFAGIDDNEEIVIPKGFLREMDDVIKNPNISAEALRGFFERLRETLKKKKNEEPDKEPDEEKDKKKKKDEEPEGDDEKGKDKKKKDEEPDEEDQAKKKKEEENPDDEEPDEEKDKKKKKDEEYPDDKKQSVQIIPARENAQKIGDHVYSKELLRPCTVRHPSGIGLVPIDRTFMERLVRNTKSILGDRIPCYIGHPEVGKEPADKIIGWVSDLSVDGSIRGKVKITNKLVHERLDEGTLRDASVGVSLGWRNESGRNVGPIITHLAITTTPLVRKLEGFHKLVASMTDTEIEVMEEVTNDPFGLKIIQDEIQDIKGKYENKLTEVNEKYEKLLGLTMRDRTEKVMQRVDRLIEDELVKPGVRKKLEEYVEKTKKYMYDEKYSVPEVILDILEVGLVKGEVSLTRRETQDTTDGREYLTMEDLEKSRGKINQFEREGLIAKDEKGNPYWAKGRPEL